MDEAESSMERCAICGAEPPSRARFCPRCGATLASGPQAATDAHPGPQLSSRTVFWLIPADVILVLLAIALGGAIALLVLGHFISGSLLLVVSVGLARLLASPATDLPSTRAGRLLSAAGDSARVRSGFAAVLVSSWSKAGREIVRLRRTRHRLEREREALIRDLGHAAYADDAELMAHCRAEAQARDSAIAACEQEAREVLSAAQARIERERMTARATRVFAAERPGASGLERPGASGE